MKNLKIKRKVSDYNVQKFQKMIILFYKEIIYNSKKIFRMKDESNSLSNQIGLEDSGSIFEMWKKLKNSIFDVLFVLLDNSNDEDETLFGIAFETGVDYLQMMAFPFDGAVIAVWNAGDTLENITGIFGQLNVSTYIPGIQFGTFLILLYSLIFMIIFVIIDIIYVGYSFSKKKFQFTWPLVLLAKIVPLFVTVLFLPIMETLLEVVNCGSEGASNPNQQVMITFPDVVCWQGWHLFHSVVTLLFSSIFVFISCIVTLALFEPRMTSNRLTARQNSTGQVVFIINKIICQFFFSFSPFQSSLPYTLMLFVLSGWLYSTYNIARPYYQPKASKFFRIVSTYYFWTNLMLMISEILRPLNFKGGLIIWICGLLCISFGIIFERKSKIETLFSSSLKFKSGEELESHLQYVLQLLHKRNEDKNSYMLLLGYIEKHIQICTEDDCPLRVRDPTLTSSKQQEQFSCNQLLKQLQRQFKTGIKKYPQCTKLRLTFAFFYMEKMNNTKKSYEQFTKALKTDPSFGEQFIIYRFRKIIRENLEAKAQNGDKADLIDMIRFDNYISLCEEAMLLSARLHKDFWIQLQEQSPDLNKLNEIGNQITETLSVIQANYKQIMKLENTSPELQYNHAFYLIFVMQDIQLGKSLLNQAKIRYQQKISDEFIQENEEEDQFSFTVTQKNSGVIIINPSDNQYKILKVNKNFVEFLKYSQQEILDRQLNKIMLNLFNFEHNQSISAWLKQNNEKPIEYTKQSYVGNPQKGYLKDRSGFLKSVEYTVRYLTNKNQFVMEFSPIVCQTNEFFLGTDKIGFITDMSAGAYSYFQDEDILLDFRTIFDLEINQIGDQFPLKWNQKSFLVSVQEISKTNTDSDPACTVQEIVKSDGTVLVKNKVGYIAHFTQIYKSPNKSVPKLQKKKYIPEKCDFLDFRNEIVQVYAIQQEVKQSIIRKKTIDKEEQDLLVSKVQENFGVYVDLDGEEREIKTYRYLNGRLKRLYFDGLLESSSDYDFEIPEMDIQGRINEQKLRDTHYLTKISEAINTYIIHPEVKILFSMSVLMLISFVGLIIWDYADLSNDLLIKEGQINQIINNTNDIYFILNKIREPLFENYSLAQLEQQIKEIQSYKITYYMLLEDSSEDAQKIDEYVLSNSTISGDLTIRQALSILQAHVLAYYHELIQEDLAANNSLLEKQLSLSYQNYLKNIYPELNRCFNLEEKVVYFPILAVLAFLWVLFGFFWLYSVLTMKRKAFGILIWFLDIPLDYVQFLQKKCVYFIRNYIGVKDIINKRIRLHEQVHYIQEYHELIEDNSQHQKQDVEEENEMDDGNNNRKILVTRYRKSDIFSRFQCRQLLLFLIMVYGLLYSVTLFVYNRLSQQQVDFLLQSYQVQEKNLVWLQTFPLLQKILLVGEEWSQIDNQLFYSQIQNIRERYQNMMTGSDIVPLFQTLLQRDDSISEEFVSIFDGNLCQYMNLGYQQQKKCEKSLNSTLIGGVSTFIQFLSRQPLKSCQFFLQELYNTEKMYVGSSLKKMLENWSGIMSQQILSFRQIMQISLYVYIICSLLMFLTVWLLYLHRLNLRLNRTIQMLNMIPMVLLPELRKEMRDFLNWILLEANRQSAKK